MPVRGFWQNRTIRELPPLPVLRRGENIPQRFLTRDRVLPHWVEALRSYRMPNSVYYDRTRSFIRGIVIIPGRLAGKDTDEACYFFVNMHCALPPKDTARVLSRYFDTDEKVRKLVHKPYAKGVTDPIFHPGVHANMDEAIRYWKHFDNHETVNGSFMNLPNLTNALSSTYDRNSFLWQDGKWKVYLVHSPLKWRPIDPHNPDDCFK